MAREGERADNRINRVSSERPTTTPHAKKWKFDIRSFCSVRGITGKTHPLVVVLGVPGGGEVKPLIHLSQKQQKSEEESSTTNPPPTLPCTQNGPPGPGNPRHSDREASFVSVATPSDWLPSTVLDSVANWYWVERPTQAHHLHIGGVSSGGPENGLKGFASRSPINHRSVSQSYLNASD